MTGANMVYGGFQSILLSKRCGSNQWWSYGPYRTVAGFLYVPEVFSRPVSLVIWTW